MRREHLDLLVCPDCQAGLTISSVTEEDASRIREGELLCPTCGTAYPIRGSIPRFVPLENYAFNFGLQWNKHRRTQYDSYTGVPASRNRFFEATGWPESMAGEHILEVGSGSGRFTEVCLQTGATVVSVEYSHAVEANHAQNGDDPNVLIVQADLFALPVRRGFFDRLYCFGVLQHTPSPRGAFQVLPRHVRDGGELAVDVYKANRLGRYLSFTPAPPTKYPVRLVTTRLPPEKLYRAVETYITTMWPLAGLVHRIPKIGRMLNWMALVPDHFNLGLDDATAREWAVLNCYDMLSPRYDNPQHISEVRSWFDTPMFRDASVTYGHNGIVGKARVAARPRPVPDNHPRVPSEKEA